MRTINLMLAVAFSSVLSMSQCQNVEVKSASTNLEKCDLSTKYDVLKTVENGEGTVEEYIINSNGNKDVTYVVKYPNAPTGYLAVCNLPQDLKQVGVRLKFSGTIYKLKNMELLNLNAVPTEFTNVTNVSSDK